MEKSLVSWYKKCHILDKRLQLLIDNEPVKALEYFKVLIHTILNDCYKDYYIKVDDIDLHQASENSYYVELCIIGTPKINGLYNKEFITGIGSSIKVDKAANIIINDTFSKESLLKSSQLFLISLVNRIKNIIDDNKVSYI